MRTERLLARARAAREDYSEASAEYNRIRGAWTSLPGDLGWMSDLQRAAEKQSAAIDRYLQALDSFRELAGGWG